ncbi:beta-ketoacyl-[acyl-carrier-protein] synthase family protein [Candidatus Daviesbacteria bacterium]|nr:beta-ketoacyl-[acyl-carrier-protein] synthase family protein [Candidatus Daviesbacteria bacterium]
MAQPDIQLPELLSTIHQQASFRDKASTIGIIFGIKSPRNVVVTGLSALTPIGSSVESFWQGLLKMKSGVIPFDVGNWRTSIAAPVAYFNPANHFTPKELRQISRPEAMGIKLVRDALKSAAAEQDGQIRLGINRTRVGNYFSTGYGGAARIIEVHDTLCREVAGVVDLKTNSERVGPILSRQLMPEQVNGMVGIYTGARGSGGNPIQACATSLTSATEGAESVFIGNNDMAIVGGLEELLGVSPYDYYGPESIAIFASTRGALSTRNHDPEGASRPFDKDRDGFVLASGGGALILEEEQHALKRSAPIYARVLGFHNNQDGHMPTQLYIPNVALTLVKACMDRQTEEPYPFNAFFAHATSTQAGDVAEANAFRVACAVLGMDETTIPITAIKSMVGHMAGGSGAANLVATVMALRRGKIPAIRNLENPDPDVADLMLVKDHYLERNIRTALATAYGFGGFNAAMLLGKYIRRFSRRYYQRGFLANAA